MDVPGYRALRITLYLIDDNSATCDRKEFIAVSENIIMLASIADELEEFISQTVPASRTVKKYGGTLFTLKPDEKEGQFCGVFIYTKHVQISFSDGADLDDPKNLLSGSGKRRRHLNFPNLIEVDYDGLTRFLKQASKLSVSR